jgi:exodeoxyribonuclease VII large subunit
MAAWDIPGEAAGAAGAAAGAEKYRGAAGVDPFAPPVGVLAGSGFAASGFDEGAYPEFFSAGAAAGAAGEEQAPAALTVTQLVDVTNSQLSRLGTLTIEGEISGFKGPARSGHLYFALKDEKSRIDVVVWRGRAAKLGFRPEDGQLVEATGTLDVYGGSGKLSFVIERLELAGLGQLARQVEELKRKLAAEGLFDDARKRPVPAFCQRVAVVTSMSGSVKGDVQRTLARRNPLVAIDFVNVPVQGAGAEAGIARGLAAADRLGADAILLVRGGGSWEDLMCFNTEVVARAIVACKTPVVTGIGHEPDVTIADLVADRRASTPTGAAESVAPSLQEIVDVINARRGRLERALTTCVARERKVSDDLGRRLALAVTSDLAVKAERVEALAARPVLADPGRYLQKLREDADRTEQRLVDALPRLVETRAARLDHLSARLVAAGEHVVPARAAAVEARATALGHAMAAQMSAHERALATAAASLEALSPLRVLSRGYAYVSTPAGAVVMHASDVAVGEELAVRMQDGTIAATVTRVEAGALGA